MCEGAMCQDEVVDVKDDAWGGWSPEGDPAWFDQPATLVPKDAGLPEKARLLTRTLILALGLTLTPQPQPRPQP